MSSQSVLHSRWEEEDRQYVPIEYEHLYSERKLYTLRDNGIIGSVWKEGLSYIADVNKHQEYLSSNEFDTLREAMNAVERVIFYGNITT